MTVEIREITPLGWWMARARHGLYYRHSFRGMTPIHAHNERVWLLNRCLNKRNKIIRIKTKKGIIKNVIMGEIINDD